MRGHIDSCFCPICCFILGLIIVIVLLQRGLIDSCFCLVCIILGLIIVIVLLPVYSHNQGCGSGFI
jgi:DMSO reductase anchor subunit